MNFIGNFLKELLEIYISTILKEEKEEKMNEIYELINGMFNDIFDIFSQDTQIMKKCPNCNTEIHRKESIYCFYCGTALK